jgi:hypothetical protein
VGVTPEINNTTPTISVNPASKTGARLVAECDQHDRFEHTETTGHVRHRRNNLRTPEQGNGTDCSNAKAKGNCAKRNCSRDSASLNACGAVNAHAHRAAGQHANPYRIAQGIGDKRSLSDDAIRQLNTHVA